VGKKTVETTETSETPVHSALEDVEEMSLEDQLAIVEDEMVDRDKGEDGKTVVVDDETADSEESEETVEGTSGDEIPEEFRGVVRKEVDMQVRIAQLEAENSGLKSRYEQSEAVEDEEDEYDFDVGDLDPSFEGIRESLNAMGTLHITEQKRLEKKVDALIAKQEMQERAAVARHVKTVMGIDDAEESAVLKFADDNGLTIYDQKSLVGSVKLYRQAKELSDMKAKQTKTRKAIANPRTSRSVSKSGSAGSESTVGGNSFEDSWARAVQKTNNRLAKGNLR